jgi:hypothetical protein
MRRFVAHLIDAPATRDVELPVRRPIFPVAAQQQTGRV